MSSDQDNVPQVPNLFFCSWEMGSAHTSLSAPTFCFWGVLNTFPAPCMA